MTELKMEDEQWMKRYLLGELDEDEQRPLEERLLTDAAYGQQLRSVEDELIDAYVMGRLSRPEQERFEQHFLCTPERQQRLKLARALRRYASQPERSASIAPSETARARAPWWRAWAAPFPVLKPALALSLVSAGLLIIVGGALWLFFETSGQRAQIRKLRAEEAQRQQSAESLQQQLAEQRAHSDALRRQLENEQSRRVRLEQELTRLKSSPARGARAVPPSIVALVLEPGLLRESGDARTVKLPSGTDRLRLQLDLPEKRYGRYRAELRRAEGEVIQRWDHLKAQQSQAGYAVVVTVPARLLTRGDYMATLHGETPDVNDPQSKIGTYYFRITR